MAELERMEAAARRAADLVRAQLEPGTSFILIMVEHSKPMPRATYISTMHRGDRATVLREFLDKWSHGGDGPGEDKSEL